MNAHDLPDAHQPVLPRPTIVIFVGLGLLWLAAFVYAAGLRFLAFGMLISATVVGVTLGFSWLLGRSGQECQWWRPGPPLDRSAGRRTGRDEPRRTTGAFVSPSYRGARHQRPADDRTAARPEQPVRRAPT